MSGVNPLLHDDMPHAFGPPAATGTVRSRPEDFFVEEQLGFAPDGEGPHWLLQVEKRGANTAWMVRELARQAGVRERDVGYAGLKDRHAVSRQWLTLPARGSELPELGGRDWHVLQAHRHRRKLPRGALSGNRFDLLLRHVHGERDAIESRLARLATEGMPNYFGAQRFGRDGGNVAAARSMFRGRRMGREERSMLLSAARSELFNRVLAARINRGDWNLAIAGDVLMLDGTRSWFVPEPLDDTLRERVAALDLHPTGPLAGAGAAPTADVAAAVENDVLQADPELADGLVAAGLRAERRALRVRVRELQHAWEADDALRLSFRLPAGSFATALLREVGQFREFVPPAAPAQADTAPR